MPNKNRYFVQICRSSAGIDEQISEESYNRIDRVSPYFYQLKRMCKDEENLTGRGPLVLARLDIDEFDESKLRHRKLFNNIISPNSAKGFLGLKNNPEPSEIGDFKKNNVLFLLIDEYGNWMKVTKELLDTDIMWKFLSGPYIIHSPDNLFEWFESKGRPNMQYFVIYNQIRYRFPKNFAPGVKAFRKFFVENSRYFGENVKFVEIHNIHTASLCGISEEGVLHHFVHKSKVINTKGDDIKVFNIDMTVNKNSDNFESKNVDQAMLYNCRNT